MVLLTNGRLSAEISEVGAELRSLRKDGVEYMWNGDARVWANTAPVLFPTLCFLKNNQYTLDGKTYPMTKHGFVRGKPFVVETASATSATFLHTDNAETREMYPFAFAFRVTFTLVGESLAVEYCVDNRNDTTLYFSVGAHEAYATPEGIEDYDLLFPYREQFETHLLLDGLLTKETMTIAKDTACLPLYDKYFPMLDTLIFKNLQSREVVLRNRKTGRTVKVAFPDCAYLAIWHKPGAGYLCIEPWSGLPDNADTDGNLKTKEGILSLAPRAQYRNVHTITI